jgi:hypothetical protein
MDCYEEPTYHRHPLVATSVRRRFHRVLRTTAKPRVRVDSGSIVFMAFHRASLEIHHRLTLVGGNIQDEKAIGCGIVGGNR